MEVITIDSDNESVQSVKRVKRTKDRGPNACNWCFTWHISAVDPQGTQHPDVVYKYMESCMDEWEGVVFAFAGREIAPSSGSKHLQGFVKFEKKKRLSALKKFNNTISWHKADGTWEQNWIYCTKEDKEPHIVGELPEFGNNGAREKNRWDQAWKLAQEGRLDEIDKDILLRTYTGCKMVARDYQKKPQPLQEYCAEWIYGTTGSGKSTLARSENPDNYPKECNKWWCGYQKEKCVIVEDIDPESAKYINRYCKIWADKFAFVGENKAGSYMIRPEKVVFTSQYTIEECFNPRDAAAIRRRCRVRKIENFKEVADDSAPDETAAPGTVGTFVAPVCPTPEPQVRNLEEEYAQRCDDLRRGVDIEWTNAQSTQPTQQVDE